MAEQRPAAHLARGLRGIGLSGVTPRRTAPGPAGLVFGYGGIAEDAIDAGIRALADVIAATRQAARPAAAAVGPGLAG